MDDKLVDIAAQAVAGLSSAQLGCPIYDSDEHAIARAVLAAVIGPIYAQALEDAARVADDFSWILPMHDTAARQIAAEIRALKEAGGDRPA